MVSKDYQQYYASIHGFVLSKDEPQIKWARFHDWYKGGGRREFIYAFGKETGITINDGVNRDDLVAAAIPKSVGDFEKKILNVAFYRAHATFLSGCPPNNLRTRLF